MNIPSHLHEGEFFKGNVKYISMGPFNSKYSIVLNGATIKVKNAIHVRCASAKIIISSILWIENN